MEAEELAGTRRADPRRGTVTIREYGEKEFMPAMLHLRPNSVETYESHLRKHIYPAFGKKKMAELTRSQVQSFVAKISRQLAPSTTVTVYSVLRVMMQHAVDADPAVISLNPCRKVKLPKVPKRVLEPLPAEQVLALANAISPRYRVAVVLGAGLGMREGEAFGLTLPKVDFLRRRVRVVSQAQKGELAAELKTDASTRTIPADEWVLTEINAHIERFGTGPSQVIVSNRYGKVARRGPFNDAWRNAVASARTCGKPPADPQPGGECGGRCADPSHTVAKGTRFHDLRHFYASTLIAANLNPKVIQARLGHATMTETMDTYTFSPTPRTSAAGSSTRPSRKFQRNWNGTSGPPDRESAGQGPIKG